MGKARDTGNFVSDNIAYADIGNDRLGIRKTNPSTTLDVAGDVTGEQVLASKQVTLTSLPFVRNVATISANYTVTSSYNELSIGPITIANGVTVTINSGGQWTII